jgi:N-methylhydantoinase A
MLLSGPAGGLVGAGFTASASGKQKLLSFDMGGTSTDVALIDGRPRLSREGRIGPWPVAVPMVDMHTIGAGGGSIASLDSGGMLQVGPESAGADPGPACYQQGGGRPTVTDANLLLGRLRPDAFLGGRMRLDVEASHQAMGPLAENLGMSQEETAAGIVRVANEHMARALRVISVQRGVDPRRYTLISFGGAGGLHVCALADALGMTSAMVPVKAGVLSALGMLVAKPGRQRVRSRLSLLRALEDGQIANELDQLAAGGVQELVQEGVAKSDLRIQTSLDLRYVGQSYTLNIPWQGVEATIQSFHKQHQLRYGHRMDAEVELVNLRAGIEGAGNEVRLPPGRGNPNFVPLEAVQLYGVSDPVARYEREDLPRYEKLPGPLLVTEPTSTIWVEPSWSCHLDQVGNLLLEKSSGI